jgi:hypothetical protein
MHSRFTPEHLDSWRRDGVAMIRDFFTADEVAAVQADFETVFGRTAGAETGLHTKKPGETGRFNDDQFKEIKPVPIDCSPALNLIGIHPAIIAFAQQALQTEALHLYQCQAWAKFTGDADYDQPFHCDFANHTLTTPSEDATKNSITILCYFSDVSEAHGPMHYVTRPDSAKVAGPELSLTGDPAVHARLQEQLTPLGRSSAAPAGTILPYSIDIYHRGTNLTAPRGHRYALMTCFKKAGDESINFHAWQFHHRKPWRRIFEHATPEQLALFGVHKPGDPFWTEVTLARAQARYPNWDMTPYREAMRARG